MGRPAGDTKAGGVRQLIGVSGPLGIAKANAVEDADRGGGCNKAVTLGG